MKMPVCVCVCEEMREMFNFVHEHTCVVIIMTSFFFFRFCRYETSCEQEDFLPKGCVVRINGQYLQMPVSLGLSPSSLSVSSLSLQLLLLTHIIQISSLR